MGPVFPDSVSIYARDCFPGDSESLVYEIRPRFSGASARSVVLVDHLIKTEREIMSEAKKLRAFRLKLRLSQKELAGILGMKSWIPAWEGGRCTPPPFVWLALAKLENQRKLEKQNGSQVTKAGRAL